MQRVVKIAILIVSIALIYSCKKKEVSPVPPVISFMDARMADDNSYSIVRFEFYDEDGDLGLKQSENTGAQEFNLYVDYYEKQNGAWVLMSPVITYNTTEAKYDTTDLHLRVPFIENEARVSLEGETEVQLLYNFNADTFRYELVLQDRALQRSNRIVTSDIVVQ